MFSLQKGTCAFLVKNNGETYKIKHFTSQKTTLTVPCLFLTCIVLNEEIIQRNKLRKPTFFSTFLQEGSLKITLTVSAVLFTCTGWSDGCTARCSVSCTHLYWWSSRRMCTAQCSTLRINHEYILKMKKDN